MTLEEERAVEGATAPTETNAAAPATTKRKLQKFVAERAEQRAREHGEDVAAERAADFAADRAADLAAGRAADRELDRAQDRGGERAEEWGRERAEELARERAQDFAADRSLESADDAPGLAPGPVAKKKRGKQVREQQPTTPIVVEPEQPSAREAAVVIPTDAPTEPASALPSMEAYIAELAAMSVPQLVKRHVEDVGRAPRIKARVWLQRKIAWHEQARRYGGLSVAAKRRLTQLMGEIELPVPTSRSPKAEAPATRTADDLPIGTRLERRWRDRVVTATRVEAGWECEGKVHRTLSAAAKFVTRSHVSGPAFFGIWKPRKDGNQ